MLNNQTITGEVFDLISRIYHIKNVSLPTAISNTLWILDNNVPTTKLWKLCMRFNVSFTCFTIFYFIKGSFWESSKMYTFLEMDVWTLIFKSHTLLNWLSADPRIQSVVICQFHFAFRETYNAHELLYSSNFLPNLCTCKTNNLNLLSPIVRYAVTLPLPYQTKQIF